MASFDEVLTNRLSGAGLTEPTGELWERFKFCAFAARSAINQIVQGEEFAPFDRQCMKIVVAGAKCLDNGDQEVGAEVSRLGREIDRNEILKKNGTEEIIGAMSKLRDAALEVRRAGSVKV